MKKPKKSYDLHIEGLTDLYNDTIAKAKEATDPQIRRDLKSQADELVNQLQRVEQVKKFNKPKWSIKHPFSKR